MVLFLDELPEFHRRSLEVLRQPLEGGAVTIARALRSTTFPARFVLVAAMNPCPCGYLGDPRHACKCTPPLVERYVGKISGPLLDRIDLHVEVPAVPFEELSSSRAFGNASRSTVRAPFTVRVRQQPDAPARGMKRPRIAPCRVGTTTDHNTGPSIAMALFHSRRATGHPATASAVTGRDCPR